MTPLPGLPMALCALIVVGSAAYGGHAHAPGYGSYAWPVKGPVIRDFEPPDDPYGPGHRGIDIAASFGSEMRSAQDGSVAFAGWINGSLFISIDHADGVRTTYSWLSAVAVSKGEAVVRGQVIGRTGRGHPHDPTPHLHFGARVGRTYIDPMLLLERGSVVGLIHLAPLDDPGSVGGFGGRSHDLSLPVRSARRARGPPHGPPHLE